MDIISVLESLLEISTFEFEDRSVIDQAIQLTKKGKGDFSDYLIGAISSQYGYGETATFDQKLKDEKWFRMFGPGI